MKLDDMQVLPYGEQSTLNITVLQDRVWIDNWTDTTPGNTYLWSKGKWHAKKMYEIDTRESFRIAVPLHLWLYYRFQDWRDATSFRMTGKKAWWRK